MVVGQLGAIASQIFPDFDYCYIQPADDFTVPSDGWSISRVQFIGPILNDPAAPFDVIIMEDNGGVPGNEVFHESGHIAIYNAGIFEIILNNNAVLGAGTYWISVMPVMSFTSFNQWFWQTCEPPVIDNNFKIIDPCNLVGNGWTTWVEGIQINGATDLCFALYGAAGEVPVSNWALFLGIGLILVFTIFRFRKLV